MTQLPGTSLLGSAATPNAISGDGTVVVGANDNNAVKWTSPFSAQPQLLASPSNAVDSYALGVNQTGTVVVGGAIVGNNAAAIAWTPSPTYVATALAAAPNVGSFVLSSAAAVSADGKTIAGDGSSNGVSEPWVARLP